MDPIALREIVIVLAASIVIIYISHKLKLPSVVGFLLTGVLIGPGGLSLVAKIDTINVLAEIGVVMLLFTIGLEFAPERIRRLQRNFWEGGGLQVSLTIAVVAGLLVIAFGFGLRNAAFYSFLATLSSTAVVLNILKDRSETDSPYGRISLGILIFQDIALVPMIALVPVLANAARISSNTIALRFLLSGLTIGIVFAAARYLMPKILHTIVRTRIREVFLITALFICLGMAFLTSSLGLSLALGAFLAGVIIADSDYSHQVVSDILPFKDVFNSLFFISVGMLLDTAVVWKYFVYVIGIVGAVVIIKALVIVLTVIILGYGFRIAMVTGLALAQIGEFSFVLARVGHENGFMADNAFQVFIAASILTILATPFLIQFAPLMADRLGKAFGWKPWFDDRGTRTGKDFKGHVIIAGYGLNGKNLSHVLKEAGIPYVILELNPVTVRSASLEGEPIIFGDVSSRIILEEACVRQAKGIVFAISDPGMTQRGIRAVREFNPEMFIIVRTRYAADIDEFLALGAGDVIPEEFETSIEIFTRVLEKFHIPRNIINAQVKVLRGECYGMLRDSCRAAPPIANQISDLLASGTAESFFIGKDTWPVGKTLGEIDLRGRTGATVLAVVRGEESFTSPGAEFEIRAQDTLLLVASHRDMDRAFDYLTGF